MRTAETNQLATKSIYMLQENFCFSTGSSTQPCFKCHCLKLKNAISNMDFSILAHSSKAMRHTLDKKVRIVQHLSESSNKGRMDNLTAIAKTNSIFLSGKT